MSPISDAHARDAASDHSGSEKSLFEASPVRPVPLLASGSDEEDSEDRKEVRPRVSVPDSGGSSSRHSFSSGAVQDQRKGEGKGKPGKLASGSIHPTAR